MDNLHGILVFLRIVEAGSLSGAARALGVSTSAVSAALARLEERLETRLINRTTRRLNVTEEGAEYYARCKQIVTDLETAELTVGRAGRVPSGTLRVGIPSALGHNWIVPQLTEFVDAYPSVSLEIISTDFVPFTMDESLDLSIQIGELHDSNLTVRRLACSEYLVCASPEYLARHGTPEMPEELHDHACLTYRRPRNGRLWDWRFDIDDTIRLFTIEGLVTMNSHEALVSAAVAGMGIVQVADYYAYQAIQEGTLVEVLKGHKTEGHIISAVFTKQKPFPPKIRVFMDFLVRQFDRPPWNDTEPATLGRSNTDPNVRVGRVPPARRKAPSGRGPKRNSRA